MKKRNDEIKILDVEHFIKKINPIGYENISNSLYKNILNDIRYIKCCRILEIKDKILLKDEEIKETFLWTNGVVRTQLVRSE